MKRVIFTLLYENGSFMLSRNFRLQKVGGVNWLFDNYDLANVSRGLDELMIIDVTREGKDSVSFGEAVRKISERCFIPVTVGGGIADFESARMYMKSGADKLLINSLFYDDADLCKKLADKYGSQCIVAGVDYSALSGGEVSVRVHNATHDISQDLNSWVKYVQKIGAGEVLLQSIDRDGTGMGLDLDVVRHFDSMPSIPCILMGGVGKAEQIEEGLMVNGIDAVATANLFNFIGAAFLDMRDTLLSHDLNVANWDGLEFDSLKNKFA